MVELPSFEKIKSDKKKFSESFYIQHTNTEPYIGSSLTEVELSITKNRGCFGSCSFCAVNFHQGRIVTARFEDSVLKDAEELTKKKNFKGYITILKILQLTLAVLPAISREKVVPVKIDLV